MGKGRRAPYVATSLSRVPLEGLHEGPGVLASLGHSTVICVWEPLSPVRDARCGAVVRWRERHERGWPAGGHWVWRGGGPIAEMRRARAGARPES